MLKFTKNRSNSVERKLPVDVRFTTETLVAATETPRLANRRSSSLERPRPRRQLYFDRNVTPRMISAQRALVAASSPPPPTPPLVRTATVKTASDINDDSTSDYMEVSSTTYCRRPKPTLAPLTPTLEKLCKVSEEGLIAPKKSVLKNASPRYDFHRAIERLVEKLDLPMLDTSSESGYGSDDHESLRTCGSSSPPPPPLPARHRSRTKRVHFDSYVLLLQGMRERNLELVQTSVREVCAEALATEELLLEFLRAVVDGQELLCRELLNFGVDPNFADPSGLTALHLAAAVNSLPLVKLLLKSGAAVFSRAHSSGKTASEMCGQQACRAYLRCMEECLGVANAGKVFAARTYRTCRGDELCVKEGEGLTVVRKGDYEGSAWWWCREEQGQQKEGYVLKDLLSLHKPCC